MLICPKCHSEIEAGKAHCEACGTESAYAVKHQKSHHKTINFWEGFGIGIVALSLFFSVYTNRQKNQHNNSSCREKTCPVMVAAKPDAMPTNSANNKDSEPEIQKKPDEKQLTEILKNMESPVAEKRLESVKSLEECMLSGTSGLSWQISEKLLKMLKV